MLLVIFLLVTVVSIAITIPVSGRNAMDEFCKLECKKDVKKNYKFCC